MINSFCLRCKKRTESKHCVVIGNKQISSVCVVCNQPRYSFIKSHKIIKLINDTNKMEVN